MEIKIIEDTKGRVVFELINADHTLANVLKEKISQQKGVKICSYNVEHPLVSFPKFLIEAANAKAAIEGAIKDLKAENADFRKQAEKA